MIIQSYENGKTKVRIWVDDQENPTCAMLLSDCRMRIIGFPKTDEILNKVIDFFKEKVMLGKIEKIEKYIVLFYYESEWESLLTDIFKDKTIHKSSREYYELDLRTIDVKNSYNNLDYEIKDAVELALGNKEYEFIDELREEMCSESESIIEFSKNCFGFCAIKDNKIIGYCLSEYNNENGCEIGIGVREEYQQKGIATKLAYELFQEAKAKGINTIGWGCYKKNIPSVKTAIKLGLKKVKEYNSFYIKY